MSSFMNGTSEGLNGHTTYSPKNRYKLPSFCIDEARPMKVVIIGAGYSVLFLQRIKSLELTIYEANAGIGGTWGLACDIPSHCYQPTFAENSSFYAPGPEIQAFLESVVEKFHLGPYIKLQHRLTHIEDTADVLFTGIGSLGRWQWPEIEGLETDSNRTRTPAEGEGNFELRTWGKSAKRNTFTDKDKQNFRDKEYYREFQRGLESDLNGAHLATLRGNPLQQGAREIFEKIMRQKLSKKPWIAEHLIPDFSVACHRLTPGPGYLEALCEENVEFVPENIRQITPTGIETVDDRHRDLDVIVCATGFNTSYKLPFTFMGIAVDGFSNWFSALGPNTGVGAGSLIEVKKKAVDDFDAYLDIQFKLRSFSVFGAKCRLWYKVGKEEGRVVSLWPGSCLHCIKALENPRWEDYDYEPLDPDNNRFLWLGNGNTLADKMTGSDRSWYLSPEEVDIPGLY
ncbi:hypothetical protein F5876DRAFT_85648 [Lentinula aff. lateritia]|uniref:Uncharacterized protein n=1 Tax=Lentinula aff. lateritia TaxID=2804960 RepID=A0ACC1UFY9_9AGAR|nr:hypothetical protein F5876DRAFT_85648 [Lentinula aff. lateritia]